MRKMIMIIGVLVVLSGPFIGYYIGILQGKNQCASKIEKIEVEYLSSLIESKKRQLRCKEDLYEAIITAGVLSGDHEYYFALMEEHGMTRIRPE